MNPTAWLAWLARQLGVENPRRLRLWLLRLFVLPPEQARPWPQALTWTGRQLETQLARELGISRPARTGEWLLRLFVLAPPAPPATSRHRAVRPLRTVLHSYAYMPLRRLCHWLTAPLRALQARYAGLDFARAGARLESVAARAFELPLPLRMGLIGLSALLFCLAATTPLDWTEQFLFLLLLWITTLLIRRMPGNLPTLVLTAFSLVATARYVWWRLTQTLDLDSPLAYVFGIGLLIAEAYTWLIMLLGYFQNIWPLQRKVAPLPADTTLWPSVDIFIPTYNEPLKVVKTSVFAARGLDWPQDRLNIYLLDDGRREEFGRFAAEAGVHYIRRADNAHAKAGNLNHALKLTQGDFIAVFDCDHIPVRSFLQTTMGWFLRDSKCAMLQTPHHFFSPDPFERNLDTFRRVPNEGKLFYGLTQDGNDLWNATFFCGSCAIIRRGPLQQIGGIAVETVTEDAHTALKLHRLGYNTAYINLAQAAGLATESLSGHIGQRIRWARGMVQIFRSDNPMLGKGLKLHQRLCYGNAMLHFLNGLPRLVFLTAPLAYLYLQLHVINASAYVLAIYVLPHLIQSTLANSRMQGRYRHSFWAEVYESVLAWYITLPTLMALINPKLGKFNVTAKGGLIERDYFDWYISKPYLALLLLNFGGLALGVMRLFYWNTFETATVVMNLAWTSHNLVMLGTAMAVASEARQLRVSHRVPMKMPATLHLADGQTLNCSTRNYSTGGLDLQIDRQAALPDDSRVRVSLNRGDREFSFAARIVNRRDDGIGLRFDQLALEDEMRLIQCTFGRADAWLGWNDNYTRDQPLRSFAEVLSYGFRGYRHMLGNLADAVAARVAEQRGPQRAPSR